MKWENAELSLIAEIGDGAHASLKRVKSGIPYLTAKNITKNGISYSNIDFISEETYEKYFKEKSNALTKPQKNDILYSIIGSIGGVYCVKDEKIGISSSVAIIRANSELIFPQYLAYFLKSKFFEAQVQAIKGGVAQGFMSIEKLKNVNILYPKNLDYQAKFVSILSAYDDLIENNQKQIKLLEEAAQRLYKDWFVDLRFPGYEKTPIIDGVPKGWKEQTLADIADVVMGQSPKSEFYNEQKNGLPFHQGVANFATRFVDDEIYSTSFTRVAEANSILFSVRAPVGRINITKNKIVIGRGLAAINHKFGYQNYLFYLLKERFFKDNLIGNGSIFSSISKDELLAQKFMIPVDSLVKYYNHIAENIDLKIFALDTQIKVMIEARNRLLSKLMNGEIEV